MKPVFVLAALYLSTFCFVQPTSAQASNSGKIEALIADPGDFIVQLETAGRCGTRYFHIQRANVNFKEMTALAMTAFTTGKTMTLYVASCRGDRNVVSHGFVTR